MEQVFLAPPHYFMIETALACNLKCPLCAIGGAFTGRTSGILNYSKFLEIIEKIRPFAKYVQLHIWGEPTLNKDIYKMIQIISTFAQSNISTHALLLDAQKCSQLINSGVTDLIVSIDGVSQPVYEKYRVGGDVKTALRNLALLAHFNQLNGNNVNIIPQFILFKHNQHEAEGFAQYCQRIGLTPKFKAPYLRDSNFENSDYAEYHRPTFRDVESLRVAMKECNDPRSVFTILNDGSCVICCHDYSGKTTFGNIFESEVLEIWNSQSYLEYRKDVITGNAPQFCVEECQSWTLE